MTRIFVVPRSALTPVGATFVTPSTCFKVATTWPVWSVRARTVIGAADPAGKCVPSVARPAADSVSPRKASACGSPTRVPRMPEARTASTAGIQNTVLPGEAPMAARYRASASGIPGCVRNAGRAR